MKIFKMGEFEVYPSLNVAYESFNERIAMEDIENDVRLEMSTGLTSDKLFSDVALEGIGDTIANMASKAKSNIVAYSKKLVNMLFGWLINFFKGGSSMKEIMRKNYEKAKKYLKKLNEMEKDVRDLNQEKTISIRDNGTCVIVGLTMLQAIKVVVEDTKKSVEGISTSDGNVSGAFEAFIGTLVKLYGSLGNINVSNAKDLKVTLRAKKWNVQGLLDEADVLTGAQLEKAADTGKANAEKREENLKKSRRIVEDDEARKNTIKKDMEDIKNERKAQKAEAEKKKKEAAGESILASILGSGMIYSFEKDDPNNIPSNTPVEMGKGGESKIIGDKSKSDNNTGSNNGGQAMDKQQAIERVKDIINKIEERNKNGTLTKESHNQFVESIGELVTKYNLQTKDYPNIPDFNPNKGSSDTQKEDSNKQNENKDQSTENGEQKQENGDKQEEKKDPKKERSKPIITEQEWEIMKEKIKLEEALKMVESFKTNYDNKIDETIKYMEKPTTAEMSPNEAFATLRDQLDTFINFAKANTWNLEECMKTSEQMRRSMDKALNNLDANGTDEEVVKEMMKTVLVLGNSFATLQSGVNSVMKRVKVVMDNIFTDTSKLGSVATKISK